MTYEDHEDRQGVFVRLWTIDLLDGDFHAALLFNQLLWWHRPNLDGSPKLRYERDGHRWLLRADDGWEEECRMTTKQVRRVRSVLVGKGLVEHRRFKLNGAPTSAWRPLHDAIQAIRPKPELPSEGQFHGSAPQGAVGSDPPGAVPIPYSRDLEIESKELPAAAPPTKAKKAQSYSEAADQLARAEWERRTEKPVCGFPALRSRINEALDAGHSVAAVARVLPTMPAFSRNAFDFALRGKAKPRTADSAMEADPNYWEEP